MYIRIMDCSYDNLPQDKAEWLERFVGDAEGEKFVPITDGDSSLVRDIDTRYPVTVEELIAEGTHETIVCAMESEAIAKLRAAGYQERKGYWTGEREFTRP